MSGRVRKSKGEWEVMLDANEQPVFVCCGSNSISVVAVAPLIACSYEGMDIQTLGILPNTDG